MNATNPPSQLRSRLILLLIAVMFLGSFGVAAFLRFTGWTPQASRNFGELLQPPVDLGDVKPLRVDGTPYAWSPEQNMWRIVAVPASDCAAACARTYDLLHRVWLSQGRRAERINVLWFGSLPAQATRFQGLVPMQSNAALLQALPEPPASGAVAVVLVDPSGFMALRYPEGFDPSGLRKDLGKLVK